MSHHPEIPRIRQIARHAAPRVVEATVVPTVLFLVGNAVFGLGGALAAALAWSWGRIAWRHLTGRPVGGLLPIGATGLLLRSALALISGSTFVYFAGPALMTAIVGLGFVASAATDQPVIARVVGDIVPLSEATLARPATGRLLRRLSVLWGVEQVISAAVNLWMFRHLPLARYLVLRGPVGWAFALSTLAISLAAGKRLLGPPAVLPEPVVAPALV